LGALFAKAIVRKTNQQAKSSVSNAKFFVVGMGASAVLLEAFKQNFFP